MAMKESLEEDEWWGTYWTCDKCGGDTMAGAIDPNFCSVCGQKQDEPTYFWERKEKCNGIEVTGRTTDRYTEKQMGGMVYFSGWEKVGEIK